MYKINYNSIISILSCGNTYEIDKEIFIKSVDKTNSILKNVIDKFSEFDVDILSILGLRNLSSFIGEVYVSSIAKESDGLLVKNPHQDGYPDLLYMSDIGKREWEELKNSNKLKEKQPFSNFISGGIEIKATCGSVFSASDCIKKGIDKPGIGDQRVDLLVDYEWKAHHRQTNQLLGIFWDFISEIPYIISLFYSNLLIEDDWGKIVYPKKDGGRTTSVSIMKKSGIKKMYNNWILTIDDDRYINFFNKKNNDNIM